MKKTDLIVVSSYPKKGATHGESTVGVASYTKNTLMALSKSSKEKLQIVVLAEVLPDLEKEYQENNIKVIRCWQRNSWLAFCQILSKIKKIKANKILIEYELAMMGKPVMNLPFPIFLLILKLLNKKITVIFHQVLLDFSQMSGHIGEKKQSLKTKSLSLLAVFFFKWMVKLADKVIVFEKFLKQRLAKITNVENVIVIPHGVEPPGKEKINQKQVRKKLGLSENDFILAIFGFLAWYKGTDWLTDTVKNYLDNKQNSGLKLMIVGGPNPNHLDKNYYLKYIKNIEETASKYPKNIIVTGFVEEEKIPLFHRAADIMLFPYRTTMSSSGPLAFAFTHQKPFLVSNSLAEILDTNDIAKNLKKFEISKKDLSFPLNENTFWQKVESLRKSDQLKRKIIKLDQQVTKERSWERIGKQYYKILFKKAAYQYGKD